MKKPSEEIKQHIIKAAFLHNAIIWPGVTGSEKTISKIAGVQYRFHEQGLILSVKNKAAIVKNSLVPWPNVANVILEDGELADI